MNKLAVISGASRGIGLAIAEYFAAQSYDVALLARNQQALSKVKQSIESTYGVNAHTYSVDVANLQQVQQCIQQLTERYKHIDILFNNAGVLIEETSTIQPDDFHHMVHVNLLGAYNLIYCVTPQMKEQRSGYIFNVSSMSAKRALPKFGAYSLTKFGLSGYNQALFKELAEFNIKVTALCPSAIDTEMTKDFANFPNDQKLQVDDIVKTVDYLLSLGENACIEEVVIHCKRVVVGNQYTKD